MTIHKKQKRKKILNQFVKTSGIDTSRVTERYIESVMDNNLITPLLDREAEALYDNPYSSPKQRQISEDYDLGGW